MSVQARFRIRVAQILVLAFVAGGAGSACAANGGGYFRGTDVFSKKPFEIKVVDAYAYREADHSDPAKQNTIVVLADKPIDAASVTDALDREDALREQLRNAKASYVTVTIMEGDDSPSLNIYQDGSVGNTAVSGGFKVALKTNDGKRVEGRCSNDPKERKEYPTDLTFAAPISVPDAGTPLPADGGDAGKSYLAYSTALRKGDVDAIARTMEKERAEAMLAHRKDPDFKQMLGFLQMSAPKEIQIKGGSVKGGHATLDVQGKDADGNEIKGKVRMLKDGNDWRIGEEHLVTVLH